MAKEMEGKKRGWQQEAAKLKDVLIYFFWGGGNFFENLCLDNED